MNNALLMNIIVFIKQVPETSSVHINPETNTLMRDGVASIMNPFDEFALEIALQLKEERGAEITAISMGPPQAKAVLREALARGADRAFLLSGVEFAGSDTWATSYALAQAVKRMCASPDLLLFGRQAIDGDTAQVGAGVSEFLNLPLVSNVLKIEINAQNFVVETVDDHGSAWIEGNLPVVLSVAKGEQALRFASLAGWLDYADDDAIKVLSAADIEADPALCGISGSPTKVNQIFTPPTRSGGVKIDASHDGELGATVILQEMAN